MGKGEERHGEQVDKHCIFNDSAEPAGLVCFATLFFFFLFRLKSQYRFAWWYVILCSKSENHISSFPRGRMPLRQIYSNLLFSLKLDRLLHAAIKNKIKKKSVANFHEPKISVWFCIEFFKHETRSPHVAQYFRFTHHYISVHNV